MPAAAQQAARTIERPTARDLVIERLRCVERALIPRSASRVLRWPDVR
jgi:hypothetical protein